MFDKLHKWWRSHIVYHYTGDIDIVNIYEIGPDYRYYKHYEHFENEPCIILHKGINASTVRFLNSGMQQLAEMCPHEYWADNKRLHHFTKTNTFRFFV